MPQLAEHLVGRAAELSSLDGTLEELERGRALTVELVGEPGIGKTRLLAELARRADARGHLVLSGSASELERDLPFWVFVDALDEYLLGLEPRVLARLGDDVRAELARVLPSLAPDAPDHVPAIHDERYRIHGAMCELLATLAATKPVVLVLDDVHWADAASIELLGGLLRRPPAAAVLLALALRPRQIPPRLSAALDRAHRDGSLTRIELGALSRDEASELTGEATHYDEGGGNPFYLLELARSPAPRTKRRAGLAGIDVPPMVLAALDEELALLSPSARRALEGAAVAGDPFEPELAAAAGDSGLPETMDALDELLRLDLVRETDVPRRFRFRHPIVRRAVYETAPGGWRLGAHERCAAALAARGAPASALAHHVERSARQGDAAAIATLREAGESAMALAPASAAAWYGGALRLLPERAGAEERIGLLLARADALVSTGEYAEGHAALLESLALVDDDALALRVTLIARCARAEQLLGRHEQAHARLTGALDTLPQGGSPESVALMAHLAYDGFFRMQFEPMLDWAARGAAEARAVGEQPVIAGAVGLLALAQACTGPIPDAERHRAEAAAVVDGLDDAQLPTYLEAFPPLAGAEVYLDRFEAAAAHAGKGLAVARATGQGRMIATLPRLLARADVCRGALADAAAVLDGAVEGGRLSGSAQELAWALLNRCFAATAAGDLETALSTGEEAVQLTRNFDLSLVSAWAGVEYAGALAAAGEPGRAVDVLVPAGGGDDLPRLPGGWRASALELLTRCRLALGQRAEAGAAAAAATACAERYGLRLAAAMAARATAAVSLDAGDARPAAEGALTSAAHADAVGTPIEAALSRTLAGRALAQGGDTAAAVDQLERAAEALAACGALRHRDAAERELRKLGRRVQRRTRAGAADGTPIETLTERELQIARLVVDRRTNTEIAAELFLSRKTIEAHLRNIFVKLGVSSRVEVAREVERARQVEGAR